MSRLFCLCYNKNHKMLMLSKRFQGFALPSIMIASVVMLMVLAAAISSVATTRGALTDQYYNQIAKEAAESGLAMAEACINGGTLTWPNPLRPGSDCNGAESQCDTASCYLLSNGQVRTTFSVDAPLNPGDTSTARAIGTVELTRTSNNAVWKSYTQDIMRLEQGEGRKLTWRQLSTGSYHTCGVGSDSKAYCWGSNSNGMLGNNSTTESSMPVAVSASGVLSGKTIKQIAVGASHSCALASDNQVYCWGWNFYGQLGNNSTTSSSVPVAVTTSGVLSGKTIRSIAVGGAHTCAIASDNLAYCWGSGWSGQLGNNSTSPSSVPVAVTTTGALSGKTIRDISAEDLTTCAIASDRQAYCWGNGGSGQLGNNAAAQSNVAVAVTTSGALSGKTIKSIEVGGYHTCAVASDNLAYCWGGNSYGQLGNNSTTQSNVPVAVNTAGALSGKTVQSISAADWSHTCVLASDDQAYCWGGNSSGQLGNNSTTQSNVAVAVSTSGVFSGKSVRSVLAGRSFSCAIASDAYVYCWGGNSSGQLATDTTTQSSVPIASSPKTDPSSGPAPNVQVTTGYSHTCAIASDNLGYCWGGGSDGSLGRGSTANSSVPVAVTTTGLFSDKTLRNISATDSHTCAVASDNKAYCWGSNLLGGLGNNSTTNSTVPVAVTTSGVLSGKNIRSITAGSFFSCAVASDNLAYCWGSNSGRLGNNGTANSSVPVAVYTAGVLSGKTILSIGAGNSHTCALASDNRPYCWGSGGSGQLGNSGTSSSNAAVAVTVSGTLSGKSVASLTVGWSHACVLASDNQVYCWGMGSTGRLGNNSTANATAPVAVTTSGVLSGKTIRAVSAGGSHTCAIASDNQAYCWGSNSNGQLGNNSTTSSSVPVAVNMSGVLSGKTLVSISTGYSHTCAIASDGGSYCWGSGYPGMLGNNSTSDSLIPVQTNSLPGYPIVEYRQLYY